jgi:hypothetical protein
MNLYKIIFLGNSYTYYVSANSFAHAVEIIIKWWNSGPGFKKSEGDIKHIEKINHSSVYNRTDFIIEADIPTEINDEK